MVADSVDSRRRWNPLAVILMVCGLLFVFFVIITAFALRRGSNGTSLASSLGRPAVGVLEVNGVIWETPAKRWLKQLKEFEKNDSVKAVVLRVNSPGGAVAPSQELYQAFLQFKKPLVVSMASVAASGGYYIALGGSKIFANPGTITGSIGVIMEFANLERLYEWAKVSRFSIKSGKFKDAGADYRTMSADERKLLQDMVDSTLGEFRATVAKRRKLGPLESEAVSDGRIFSGEQAKAVKLVDELGTLDDAVREAAKMAKIEAEPRVVYPHKPRQSFLSWVVEEAGDRDEESFDEMEELSHAGGSVSAVLGRVLAQSVRVALDLPQQTSQLKPGIYWLLPWSR
jgi:protease-4